MILLIFTYSDDNQIDDHVDHVDHDDHDDHDDNVAHVDVDHVDHVDHDDYDYHDDNVAHVNVDHVDHEDHVDKKTTPLIKAIKMTILTLKNSLNSY